MTSRTLLLLMLLLPLRSSRDLTNAAGLLRAAGETLHFSLGLQSNLGLELP